MMRLRVGQHCCQLDLCRGLQGECRFSLVRPEDVRRILAPLESRCADNTPDTSLIDISPHNCLKVAFAACPNACTMPQIKDMGFIAELAPQSLRPTCSACGRCVTVCRENAIAAFAGLPEFDSNRCIRCGMCITQCPQEAIAPALLQFAVLIGGRMGRHPRFADRLCTLSTPGLVPFIERLLTAIESQPNADRFADQIEHAGLSKLKELLHV
ncbi:MAG TPA: 4Fe-4S binding protein [Anaerohalosphaeraceae bacterium]|jgi:anaerobic sulfite reductase subunit C|nr:4Fe-4S binding protein [Anaerohalosphaeraceae bacterium]HRT52008.1 4Fe-4S binding protein [Anaerohalosphaeraceae bacterium]HRT88071.1 4Fe-4S binding protein [Anaerohalosphaeraceae bacterium]